MTSKQRAFLRSVANGTEALYQLGKGEIDEDYVIQLGKALDKRELIKISVLENAGYTPHEAAAELSARTDSEAVQVIGRKVVLYRRSRVAENRKLSAQVEALEKKRG